MLPPSYIRPILCCLGRSGGAQADAHGIGVGLQALAVGERGDHGPEVLQARRRELLRRDVLLERERVDAAELARVPVRREGVVRARRVVATADEGK